MRQTGGARDQKGPNRDELVLWVDSFLFFGQVLVLICFFRLKGVPEVLSCCLCLTIPCNKPSKPLVVCFSGKTRIFASMRELPLDFFP